MPVLRLILGVLLAAMLLCGQRKPLAVQSACAAETIQLQSLPCTQDEPCPLFLELAAAEQVASRIILTGNLHTSSLTVESVLLISDDGGSTWTEPTPRIPGAVLDQIQFLDFEAGWVNGHFLQATPKDAFFLLTTDGGRTWRKKPVAGEQRTGAVEQFWFDSRNHGLLSLDRVRAAENGFRYEMWESQTGGESWSVRQVDSKPVPFKRPARDPQLRIRADNAGKLYRIERHDGTRWLPVTTISVDAGECRPPAAEVAPEQAPPAEPGPPPEPTPPPKAPRKPPTLKKGQ